MSAFLWTLTLQDITTSGYHFVIDICISPTWVYIGFTWYITPHQLHASVLSVMQQEIAKDDFNAIGMCKRSCPYGCANESLRRRLTN